MTWNYSRMSVHTRIDPKQQRPRKPQVRIISHSPESVLTDAAYRHTNDGLGFEEAIQGNIGSMWEIELFESKNYLISLVSVL